jgi:hypothetical protein
LNFIKHELLDADNLEAPMRESFLEDFCHYFCQYNRIVEDNSPSLAAFFVKKIAASHWMTVLANVEMMLGAMRDVEESVTLDEPYDHHATSSVKDAQRKWFILQADNVLCARFCEAMDETMTSLNVSRSDDTATSQQPHSNHAIGRIVIMTSVILIGVLGTYRPDMTITLQPLWDLPVLWQTRKP